MTTPRPHPHLNKIAGRADTLLLGPQTAPRIHRRIRTPEFIMVSLRSVAVDEYITTLDAAPRDWIAIRPHEPGRLHWSRHTDDGQIIALSRAEAQALVEASGGVWDTLVGAMYDLAVIVQPEMWGPVQAAWREVHP